MSRRKLPGGPVEVVQLCGIVALGRRRGLRVAIVSQDGHEALELRSVSLAPTAKIAAQPHRMAMPLSAVPAVLALLNGVKNGEGR